MRKLKAFVATICVVCLLLVCTGCMKVNLGVEFNEDGTASLTTKMSIEESAYETLSSMGGEVTDDSVALEDFIEEEIDGKTYYSYEETEEYASYQDLVDTLSSSDASSDMNIFDKVEITGDEENGYSFKFVTLETEPIASEEMADFSLPEDWLVVTMTVKMPGSVDETNGEKIDDSTVKFVIDDFSESHTYSVTSAPNSSTAVLVVMCVSGVLFVGSAIYLVIKKSKNRNV